MVRPIKRIILFLLIPYFLLKKWMRQLRFFLLPNLLRIISRKTRFNREYPNCYQLMKITGNGKVFFGNSCFFGTKLGGFHHGGMIELQAREKNAKIIIGNNIATNNNIFLGAANLIEIGDDTLIGQYVTIMDFDAHGIDPMKRRQMGEIGKVIIGKNVWVGNNVTILKNVEIGENSIIAAGAVVVGKFPSNVIIGGVPAKIIRNL